MKNENTLHNVSTFVYTTKGILKINDHLYFWAFLKNNILNQETLQTLIDLNICEIIPNP